MQIIKKPNFIQIKLKYFVQTFIVQDLVTVEVPAPILNPTSLHSSDESTYTKGKKK